MTSEKILSAAQKLFEEKGFDLTSVREIATLAEVNVALINYHFGSKENLLLAIIENSADATRVKLSDINNSSASPAEKLRQVIAFNVAKIFANGKYYQFVHREFSNPQRAELMEGVLKILNRNSSELRKLLEDGQKKKAFKKDADIDLVIATMFGIIHQTTHNILSKRYKRGGESDESYQKRIEKYMYELIMSYLEK